MKLSPRALREIQWWCDNAVTLKQDIQHELNQLAVQIWEWCISQNIWLSAVHIPGRLKNHACSQIIMSGC